MARIRTVKPDLFINERVAACSVTAVVTYVGLFTQADDHGRHRDNAAIIAGVLWPLRAEHTPVHVEDDLQQLADAGLVCRYTGCDGKRYLHITGWFEHQKIDKPSQSRLPVCIEHHGDHRCGPCKGQCSRTTAPEAFPEASANARREIGALPARVENSRPGSVPAPAAQQEDLPHRAEAESGPSVEKPDREGVAESSPRTPGGFSEASAPGSRIVDPGSSPTGRAAPDGPAGANDLVAEYIRACSQRPPEAVLGHLGREVKKLLNEDIPVEHVRAGLARYAELQGHPSRLPSLVNDAMNRPRTGMRTAYRPWTNPGDAAAAYAEEL